MSVSTTDIMRAVWGDGWHALCSAARDGSDFTVDGTFNDPDALLDGADRLTAKGRHVWFDFHPTATRPATRASADLVEQVVALPCDLDWLHEAHKDVDLPLEVDVRKALARFELPPSVIVNTGHGLQPYWLLQSPVDADKGAELIARLHAGLRALDLETERDDLASLLRVPGSINFKADPVPVVIEFADLGRLYVPEYLDKRLPKGQAVRRGRGGGKVAQRGHEDVVARLRDDGRHQDADALEVLCSVYGGHDPYVTEAGDVGVTRPGKSAGNSASVGFVGPGIVKVFSGSWPPFAEKGRYTLNAAGDGLESADDLPSTATLSATGDKTTGEVLRGEVLDPDRFFGKQGLLHASLRAAVIGEGPIATGTDRELWHYANGVWLPNGDDEVRRRCRRLLGERWRKSHVEGVIADLKASPAFITDQQPAEWINCRNGLLDWRTGELHEHRSDVPTTYQLSVDWNASATCPTVDRWLAEVVPEDAIGLVWEVIGTAIYGDQPFHRAVLLLGPGRNGKGTLLRLVSALIGRRHISAVTLQALGESRFAAASLFGKVANIAGDLDARAIARTDLFKMATGGDLIEAEHKYGAAFRFRNRATFLFSANEPPGSADHTDGFFARWCVIPFSRLQLAPGQEDPSIEDRMHAELEGVLVRAVDGLRRAMRRGTYDRPASVVEATEGYRTNADPLRRFVDERLNVTGDPYDSETRRAVYDAYRTWCQDNGHRPLAANKFWSRLVAVDARIDPNGPTITGTRYAQGLRLDGDADVIVPIQVQQGAAPTTPPRTHGGKSKGAAPSAPDDWDPLTALDGLSPFDSEGAWHASS